MITRNFYTYQHKPLKNYAKQVADSPNQLIQLFFGTTQKEELLTLISSIKTLFPNAIIIGATTDGEISNCTVTTRENVVSITTFEHTDIIPFLFTDKDSFALGESVYENLPNECKCIIMFSDGLHSNGEEILQGFNKRPNDIVIAGGMAGDNARFKESFIIYQNTFYPEGVCGVYLVNPNLEVTTEYSFGWEPIGATMIVTKSDKNRVYTINDIPASDIFEKYLGTSIARKLPNVGIEFPLIIDRDGILISRAVKHKEKDRSLVFGGNINEGEKVRFGIGNVEYIIKNSIKKVSHLRQVPMESIFIYSCMARRRFNEEAVKKELRFISHLGTVSGFYAYGEFFSKEKYKNLLNETTTILILSESDKIPVREALPPIKLNLSNTVTAFTNLVSNITKELENLNETLEKKVEEKTEEIRDLLYHDSLTGLFSKQRLERDMDEHCTLILLNIDSFSNINIIYGFETGDKVLTIVSDILSTLLKDHRIYRVDGDEFGIVCDVSTYNEVIENINHYFEENPIEINDITFRLTFSFGVAVNDSDLLKHATLALKEAKKEGKNAFHIYTKKDLAQEEQRKRLIFINEQIFHALKEDGFIIVFQGIRNNKTKCIDKYEVLLRMQINKEIYPPHYFLDVAKLSGVNSKITRIVVEKAFAFFQGKICDFSINITQEDLEEKYLLDFLIDRSTYYGIKRDRLYLEILEGYSNQSSDILNQIRALKLAGFKISIDDFGTEYSNFERLENLNVDLIKIDGKFIKNIHRSQSSYKIVKSVCFLAEQFGIKVVAEFVENSEIQAVIDTIGIEYSQGYLFSKPSKDI